MNYPWNFFTEVIVYITWKCYTDFFFIFSNLDMAA